MIIQFKSYLDLPKLLDEVLAMEYWKDGSGAFMAVKPSGGIQIQGTWLDSAIREIEDLRRTPALHMMVNKVPPGCLVPKHQDWLKPTPQQGVNPTLERWHLPLVTNPEALWWDQENKYQHLPLGFWSGPMPYWLLHTVGNLGDQDRVHLVIDLDTPEPIGAYK